MTEVANTPVHNPQATAPVTPEHPNGPDAHVIDAQEAIRLSQLTQAFFQDFGIKGTIDKSNVTHLRNDPAGAMHILGIFHNRLTGSAKKELISYRDAKKKE